MDPTLYPYFYLHILAKNKELERFSSMRKGDTDYSSIGIDTEDVNSVSVYLRQTRYSGCEICIRITTVLDYFHLNLLELAQGAVYHRTIRSRRDEKERTNWLS